MHFSWDWLGPTSSVATVVALVVTLLYYVYWWPFHLKKPEGLTATPVNSGIKLSWHSVRRATNYNVYRTDVRAGVVDVFSSTTHHLTDTSVADGASYDYYVIAEDQGHQSPQSRSVSVKMIITPNLSPSPGNTVNVAPSPAVVDSPEAQWPLEDLRQLFPLLRNNKTVLTLLDMTSSNPDMLVSFPDICERAGVTRRQGGAGIAGLTVLIKRLNKTRWPFTYHHGQGGESVPYYKISEEMAERWRQVDSEVKAPSVGAEVSA